MMRRLHRWVATVAALLLLGVAVTGGLLALDNLVVSLRPSPAGKPAMLSPAMVHAAAHPIAAADMTRMIARTLTMFAAAEPGVAARSITERWYGTMPQGVVVTDERQPRQIVIDLRNGREVGFDKPDYPRMKFLFPWGVHETLKMLHRGDAFGIPGRVMDLLIGFALLFLLVSGLKVYLDLYRRRRMAGWRAPFWR